MIAASVLVDDGRSPHLATADEQDLVPQPAVLDVVNECRDGVIEGCADVAHAFLDRGVVDVGVHIPDKARRHGHKAAAALAEAETALAEEGGLRSEEIRVARARAIVRSGDVGVGAELLESVLETDFGSDAAGTAAGTPKEAAAREALARAAREELATAYYYGARLMRLAGKPSEEWREVSALARQHFRALAEEAKSGEGADDAARHERNVELVLNLEQSSLDELYGKPSPRDCPGGQCNGMGQRPGKKPGKKPGKGERPSKGAGMGGDIGTGW